MLHEMHDVQHHLHYASRLFGFPGWLLRQKLPKELHGISHSDLPLHTLVTGVLLGYRTAS